MCICLFITVDVSVYFHSLFHKHLRFTDVTPEKVSLSVLMKMQIAEHNSAANNQYTAHKCVFFVGKKHVKRDLTLMWNQYGKSFTFFHSFKCFVSFFFVFCCAVKHTPTQTLTCKPGKTADKLFRTECTKC